MPNRRVRRWPVPVPIDVVYYLVHAIGQPGFRDADRTAAGNVAAAAKDATCAASSTWAASCRSTPTTATCPSI